MVTDNNSCVTELVRRAADGDRVAWEQIVEDYAGLVWSVVRGFRFGEAQARDAVQTTWLRLVENLAAIRDPAALPGWLRTTARRVCLEVIRGGDRERPVESTEHPSGACIGRSFATAGGDDPEDCALRAEHRALLAEAMATLSERDRLLLELLARSDRPDYRAISAQTGMPVGSIGPTRARVLARLRATLESAGLRDAAVA